MRQLEDKNILTCDLEIYVKDLEQLKNDLKVRFGSQEKMYKHDWIATHFDLETENIDLESH